MKDHLTLRLLMIKSAKCRTVAYVVLVHCLFHFISAVVSPITSKLYFAFRMTISNNVENRHALLMGSRKLPNHGTPTEKLE